MPTYVYECSLCSDVYEVEQRITEDPLTDCRCGATGTIKRVIQPVGIAFKGSGFYVTDSRPQTDSSGETASTPACTREPSGCACSSSETSAVEG